MSNCYEKQGLPPVTQENIEDSIRDWAVADTPVSTPWEKGNCGTSSNWYLESYTYAIACSAIACVAIVCKTVRTESWQKADFVTDACVS